MKLIKCDNCGQSINPKRAVCPFCNGEVVKAVPEEPPSPPVAHAVVDDRSVEDSASLAQPWWKRPNIIIPAVVGVAFLAVFMAFGLSMLMSKDAARKPRKTLPRLLPFRKPRMPRQRRRKPWSPSSSSMQPWMWGSCSPTTRSVCRTRSMR